MTGDASAADGEDEGGAAGEATAERDGEVAPTDLKFVGPATADVLADADFDAGAIARKDVSFRMLVEAGVNPGVAAKIRRWHSLSWSFEGGADLDRRSEQVRGLEDDERAWVAAAYGDDSVDERDAEDGRSSPAGDADGEAAWVAGSAGTDRGEPSTTPDDEDLAAEQAWVEASKGADAADETLLPTEAGGTESEADADSDSEAAWRATAGAGAADDGGTDPAEADGSGDVLAAESAWRERSKPTPVTEVPGVGEAYAEQLREAGVTSVRSLATADPELVADMTGIDESRVRTWHDEASDLARAAED